jgi:hypothetical protein
MKKLVLALVFGAVSLLTIQGQEHSLFKNRQILEDQYKELTLEQKQEFFSILVSSTTSMAYEDGISFDTLSNDEIAVMYEAFDFMTSHLDEVYGELSAVCELVLRFAMLYMGFPMEGL